MLVSAISRHDGAFYNFSSMSRYGLNTDTDVDTSKSFHPMMKENIPQEDIPKILDSVNQWKNFCYKQVLGEKLNVTV